METVKFVLRIISVIILAIVYVSGWIVYIKALRKHVTATTDYSGFMFSWNIIHIVALIGLFMWAWLS